MPPQRWPAEALWEDMAPALPGFTVEVLPEIDSTNSELMRRARAGRSEAVLLVAERQSAGRGRQGRTWHGQPGAALTFSLGLTLAPGDWAGLSLAVGVTLSEALDQRIGLKWPNDLWLLDRKLAGILVETAGGGSGTAQRYTVVGVGINLAAPDGAGLSTAPAGLREVWPDAGPGEVLLRVAPALAKALQVFQAEGFAPFRPRYLHRDVLRDRHVVLSDGRTGTAAGVDERGGLLVHTAAGLVTVTSSEVSVRPDHSA
ncbi:biotin--[acetyl-CoA-carboxylase] ligase [Ramlibacter sp. AW1]|uniref:biotin--[biotin carboxyl-carrier protein] ligase n=1 Tax=Ramlibacter aurantiacus TaxID=2801330 RepID=A0A936ZVA3_9BURK|nr:biotin--[acetyl-CoA-carboxylase] ligase [Ramlibacter aurantiacus]MBL0421229.1 biotin--[acetyl-CoA-carboxylase] ligase [Ramlibacter aurantiacus]